MLKNFKISQSESKFFCINVDKNSEQGLKTKYKKYVEIFESIPLRFSFRVKLIIVYTFYCNDYSKVS